MPEFAKVNGRDTEAGSVIYAVRPEFEIGDYIFVPGILEALEGDMKCIRAYVFGPAQKTVVKITLRIAELTPEEREIIRAGSLINYNREKK